MVAVSAPGGAQSDRSLAWPHRLENYLLAAALAVMVVLPLAEITLRGVWRTGISGASTIVQHLTLVVGMLGGALAARDRRLLAIAGLTALQ